MPPYYSARIEADGNYVTWDQALQPDPGGWVERWEIDKAEFDRIRAGDIPVDPTPKPPEE